MTIPDHIVAPEQFSNFQQEVIDQIRTAIQNNKLYQAQQLTSGLRRSYEKVKGYGDIDERERDQLGNAADFAEQLIADAFSKTTIAQTCDSTRLATTRLKLEGINALIHWFSSSLKSQGTQART